MPEQNVNPRETGDWSVETLFAHLTALVGEVDRRYEQRFDAQEKAVDAAFIASEKAIAAAFDAQEKAIAKADAANEKRFEGVNEFRDQLRDQATLFMPRAESEARTSQLRDQLDQLDRRTTEAFAQVNSRLDVMAGRDRGEVDNRRESRDSSSVVIAAVGLVIAIVLATVTIVGFIISQGAS